MSNRQVTDRSALGGRIVAVLILAIVLAAAFAIWWQMRAEGRTRVEDGAASEAPAIAPDRDELPASDP